MDTTSTSPSSTDQSTTRSSTEPPAQGFVAHVGVSEHVAVELNPPNAAPPEPTFTAAQVREVAFQAAGAATGVLMQRHPDDVTPSAEVARATEAILSAYQVPGAWFGEQA